MTIHVNNIQQDIQDISFLGEYIKMNNITVKGIAIAVNNSVVSKQDWDTTVLKENDNITIIQATQGG